jgi:hypothetical protein
LNQEKIDIFSSQMKLGHVLGDLEKIIHWDWTSPQYSLVGLIGDQHRSGRREIVRKIAENIHIHNPGSVFWVTTDSSNMSDQKILDSSIPWSEGLSDEAGIYENFAIHRQRFSSAFFQLCAYVNNVKLEDVVPQIKYNYQLQGPMHGYYERFKALKNKEHRQFFLDVSELIQTITWHQTAQGIKYLIPNSDNIHERAAYMVLGLWDLWANILLMKVEEKKHITIIIETDKEFMMGEHDADHKQIILMVMNIMKDMTDISPTSIIFSNETAFPSAPLNVDTSVYLETFESDLDMFDPEQLASLKKIHVEWESGNKYAARIYDKQLGSPYLGNLNPSLIRF